MISDFHSQTLKCIFYSCYIHLNEKHAIFFYIATMHTHKVDWEKNRKFNLTSETAPVIVIIHFAFICFIFLF